MKRKFLVHNALVRWFALCFLTVLSASIVASAGELDERRAVIQRGLNFIYMFGSEEKNLDEYGSDLLWCFYSVWHTSSDRELSESAARMGRELAQRWRKLN